MTPTKMYLLLPALYNITIVFAFKFKMEWAPALLLYIMLIMAVMQSSKHLNIL